MKTSYRVVDTQTFYDALDLDEAQSSPEISAVGESAGGVSGTASSEVHDLAIGEIIRRECNLTSDQVDQILFHQRKHGIRFGEAAVALRLVSSEDVLRALSQQFHYPYSPGIERANVSREIVVAANPFSDEAEAFRELRSQLMMGVLNTAGRPRPALAVLSPDVGDGKTLVAANIAVALSQLGSRTVLVDADMRTPRQHRMFNLGQTSGLSNTLSGRVDEMPIHQVPDLPSLYLLPVGAVPPNPLELVQRHVFDMLIAELVRKFDYVVVDTPAATHGADARVIAAKCGAALVIGRRGKTRMPTLTALVNSLGKGPCTLAGVVLSDW